MRPDVSAFISYDSEYRIQVQVNPGRIGFNLHFSNLTQTLATASEAYFYLGWSVIPLLGDHDPARPKVPAIPWAGFQRSQPRLDKITEWFDTLDVGGIGIVTGQVSHLIVLDFDSDNVMEKFKAQFPDLLDTRTVISAGRGLPHLYFHLPPHLHIASQRGQGIDLLSDGRYVVAPPTSINGQPYKIVRGGLPQTLTERSIRALQRFLAQFTIDGSQRPYSAPKNPLKTALTSSEPFWPEPEDLKRLYHHHCKQGGRNDALFRTTLYARDSGWLLSETHNVMSALHVQQARTHETPARRQREAAATIKSAYSKPPRLKGKHKSHPQGVISNSAREALMQQKKTYLIRTYEGLAGKGFISGQVISSKEAVEALKGLVGRDSVLKALKTEQGGEPFFTPVSPRYAVATAKSEIDSKNALFEGRNVQAKIGKGRPQQLFRIPTNDDICRILGVEVSSSDRIEPSDLATAHQTRMALHRELIKRRPGPYPRRWLAQRLGVDKRTVDAYNRQIPIHRRPVHVETVLSWRNIERLPLDEAMQGAFLETIAGKKYPALRGIAARLLANGQGITLKQQTANFYWYGEEEPLIERLHLQQAVAIKQERVAAFMEKQRPTHNIMKFLLPTPKPAKPPRPQNPRRPLKDAAQEAQAQHLYATLNAGSTKQLSLINARRLVTTYSSTAITQALNLLVKRKPVSNPTGLLMIILPTIKTCLISS